MKRVVVAVHLTIPVLCLLRALLEPSWGMNLLKSPPYFLILGPMLHSSLSTKSVTPCLWYIHNWSTGSWRKPSQKEERAPADRRSFWMLCQDASVDFHSVFYTPFLHSIPIHQDWTILPPCGLPRNSSLLVYFFFFAIFPCSGFCLLPNYPLSRHFLNHIRLFRSHNLSCPVSCHITPCIPHCNFSSSFFFFPFHFLYFSIFPFSLVQCHWVVSPPPSPTHRVRCWTR